MAYRKPPVFVRRVFNPLAMRFPMRGVETLTVCGRRSGEPRRVPVIPVEHAGKRYLVSPRGETEWVRNLRAAGEGELRTRGHSVARFGVSELPAGERAPILAVYKDVAGKAVESHFKALPDAADHPVFRIEPRDS